MSDGLLLPNGWTSATLSELIGPDGVFTDGDWVESKDQDEDGAVRLTQLADIGVGVWKDRSRRHLTLDKAHELGCTFLRKDDVLVARMPDPLGRACLFPGTNQPCVTVVDVAVLRPGSFSVDPRWLMHIINSPTVRQSVAARQSGSTRRRVSRKNLASIRIPVPPLAEQRRVLEELERRFGHISAAVGALRIAEERTAQALRSTEHEVLHGIPLRRVGDLLGPEGMRNGKSVNDRPGGFPVLRLTSLRENSIAFTESKEGDWTREEADRFLVQRGDFFVSRGNGSLSLVGRGGLARTEPPTEVAFPDTLIRIRTDPEQIIAEYLAAVWNTGVVRKQIEAVAHTTAGIYKINQTQLADIEVPVPPLNDQSRVTLRLESRRSQLGAVNRSLETGHRRIAQLRSSLLHAAFRGELVTQDPDDEPADKLLERIREQSAPNKAASARKERK